MGEPLERAPQGAEAPSCPECGIVMEWFRSDLRQQDPIVIERHFACPKCSQSMVTTGPPEPHS